MLLRFLGGLPHEKSPLNVRRSVAVDRGAYRIEKLVYESAPKFYVTANLYVPAGRGPFPAVLQPTGHSTAAKARAFYQTLALGLVKSGFVVLTYDPLGQGERRIFYDPALGDSKVGGTTVEHQMVGAQSLFAGESIARQMVWDGIRGIDVLQSQPEVIASRIGVAGCSGGGTLTAYLATLDDRVKAASPACYITAWEEQLPGTGPQDAEQQFPDQLKAGLDHADFAIAFAPRPYLQVNTEQDFFPIAGARRAFEEAKRIYTLFGAGERIAWSVGPGGHGMPQNVREAVYGWMNQWLKDGPAGPLPEPAFQTEYEETLYCTTTGQVSTSLGGETASSVNMRRYAEMRPPRVPLDNAAAVGALRDRVREMVGRLTRYEPGVQPVRASAGVEEQREGYSLRHLTIAAPGGRETPGILATPQTVRGRAVLLVADAGARESLRAGGDGDALARLGHPVLALDIAGFGITVGKWQSYAAEWFGPDKLAWLAMMTGKPLVGLGIEDIVAGLDLLQQRNLLGDGCVGMAKGMSGVAMLHAAALDTRIAELMIEDSLTSYAAVARTPIHRRIMTAVVPGVLGSYDLPDLAAAIAGRPLALIGLHSPAGSTELSKDVREAYLYAFTAYRAAGAADRLRVGSRREGETVDAVYPDLK